MEDIHLASFDAKRDRWNGYNPDEWSKYADRFERVQQMRQELRKQELLEKAAAGEVEAEEVADELEADELKVSETEEAGAWHGTGRTRCGKRHDAARCACCWRSSPTS